MLVNIATTRPRQRVKLLAAWRDTPGVSQQRRIATLGRLEAARASDADIFVAGVPRATGVSSLVGSPGEVTIVPPLTLGATCLLTAN